MISALYLKLAGLGLLLAAVIGGFVYVPHLRSSLKAKEALVVQQREMILDLTNSKKEFDARLAAAEQQRVVIRDRVVTQIKRVPAAPTQCEPAINWLRDRALELQKDTK